MLIEKDSSIVPFKTDLATDYKEINLIDLCISCLGIFDTSSNSFLKICNGNAINADQLNFILSKLPTIVMCTTYYIFCMRDKPWCDLELLVFFPIIIIIIIIIIDVNTYIISLLAH